MFLLSSFSFSESFFCILYLLRSCLHPCGVGCFIRWEDNRPPSLTGTSDLYKSGHLVLTLSPLHTVFIQHFQPLYTQTHHSNPTLYSTKLSPKESAAIIPLPSTYRGEPQKSPVRILIGQSCVSHPFNIRQVVSEPVPVSELGLHSH